MAKVISIQRKKYTNVIPIEISHGGVEVEIEAYQEWEFHLRYFQHTSWGVTVRIYHNEDAASIIREVETSNENTNN